MPPAGYADPVTNDGPEFHLDAQNFYPSTPIRSSPSMSLWPSRQVMLTQPLRSRRPWTGPPLCMRARDVTNPTTLFHDKNCCGSGYHVFHSGRMAKCQPPTGLPVGRCRYKTLQNKCILFLANECYKVQSAMAVTKYKIPLPPQAW
jgi:hypothetical protein